MQLRKKEFTQEQIQDIKSDIQDIIDCINEFGFERYEQTFVGEAKKGLLKLIYNFFTLPKCSLHFEFKEAIKPRLNKLRSNEANRVWKNIISLDNQAKEDDSKGLLGHGLCIIKQSIGVDCLGNMREILILGKPYMDQNQVSKIGYGFIISNSNQSLYDYCKQSFNVYTG